MGVTNLGGKIPRVAKIKQSSFWMANFQWSKLIQPGNAFKIEYYIELKSITLKSEGQFDQVFY